MAITLQDALQRTIEHREIFHDEMLSLMRRIMSGEVTPVMIAALTVGLRVKKETIGEIAAAAQVMREFAIKVVVPDTDNLVDIVGTGGDASHTFNISTASMFVAAAAGARVAKHGNRSVSSRCGSADVLQALGAKVELGPRAASRALEATGFCFLFAPRYHPSMRRVAPVRQALGVRTLFNWMGPLANPARASHQLLGIPDASRLDVVARVLSALGVKRALVVHGTGGLDELSLEEGNEALLVERLRGSPAPFDPGRSIPGAAYACWRKRRPSALTPFRAPSSNRGPSMSCGRSGATRRPKSACPRLAMSSASSRMTASAAC